MASTTQQINENTVVHEDASLAVRRYFTILHRGRTLAVAAAELTNAEGKQVALATGSSMYLPGRPANLVGVELGSGSSDPEDDPGA